MCYFALTRIILYITEEVVYRTFRGAVQKNLHSQLKCPLRKCKILLWGEKNFMKFCFEKKQTEFVDEEKKKLHFCSYFC